MKLRLYNRFIILFLLGLSHRAVLSQSLSISNASIKLNQNTSNAYNYLSASNLNNNNFNFLDNIGIWVLTIKNADTFMCIQNGPGYNDFSIGPISFNQKDSHFLKINKITQQQIKSHKNNLTNISAEIKNWPASTNNQVFASFIDFNSNTMYEPQLGELPNIRGEETMVSIHNDLQNHKNNFNAVNIESINYFYVFPSSGDLLFENTIGFRFVLKNKSDKNYDSIKIGINFHAFFDTSLQNYIATDVLNNAMIGYPKNNIEGNYLSVILLNKTLKNTHYYTQKTNDQNGLPINKYDYLNYMNGKWKGGNKMVLGNLGIDGTKTIDYAFPNKTAGDSNFWKEDTEQNIPGDRNGLMIFEQNYWPKENFIVIDGAIVLHHNLDSLEATYPKHDVIANAYRFNQFKTNKTTLSVQDKIEIYPNPFSSFTSINSSSIITQYELYDMNGTLIKNEIIEPSLHFALNLANYSNGIYLLKIKHKLFKILKT